MCFLFFNEFFFSLCAICMIMDAVGCTKFFLALFYKFLIMIYLIFKAKDKYKEIFLWFMFSKTKKVLL